MRRAAWLLLAALAVAGCKKKPARVVDDGIVEVPSEDATMNAAIADARAHLAVFEAELAAPHPDRRYVIKKGFPTPSGGHEHMWLGDVRAVEGGFEGRLDNEPRDVTDVRYGERYRVRRDEVSDWMIRDETPRIWGGYTIRAVLPTMPADQRQAVQAMLQPLPP